MKKLVKKPNEQKWLTTYSDMVTLLLVFFVMLIAIGETKIVRTQIILSAFSGRFGFLKGGLSLNDVSQFETMGANIKSLPSQTKGKNLEKKKRKATSLYHPLLKSKRVQIVENERGIVISLFADIFFEGADAKVKIDAARNALEEIRLFLDNQAFQNNILIEGHTDSTPYLGSKFKDNWELSLQRAWNVLEILRRIPSINSLNEKKISLHGYGSTKPIDDNNTPEGRAYNRRVDIVLQRK